MVEQVQCTGHNNVHRHGSRFIAPLAAAGLFLSGCTGHSDGLVAASTTRASSLTEASSATPSSRNAFVTVSPNTTAAPSAGSESAPNATVSPRALGHAVLTFDSLGSTDSSIIQVYAGPGTGEADHEVAGTFASGQKTTAACKTTGRTVTSDPSAHEEQRRSNVWVQVVGAPGVPSFATMTCADMDSRALATLPLCS